MKVLDACGYSCPEPLLMLQKALKTDLELTLLVDSKNARKDCEEYAKRQGFTVNVVTENEVFKLVIVKN